MDRLATFLGATVAGAGGGWLGEFLGVMADVVLGAFGSGIGSCDARFEVF